MVCSYTVYLLGGLSFGKNLYYMLLPPPAPFIGEAGPYYRSVMQPVCATLAMLSYFIVTGAAAIVRALFGLTPKTKTN